jgi:hypothetical protein
VFLNLFNQFLLIENNFLIPHLYRKSLPQPKSPPLLG